MAKRASARLGTVVPQLHFSSSNVDSWARDKLTCQELYDELEILRLGVKHATGYAFDNTHFYFDDGYGKPALQFSVWPHDTSLMVWECHHGTWVGNIPLSHISGVIHMVELDQVICNECQAWGSYQDCVRFGYTGIVCKACYDPKKHLPPDSSG